MVRTGRLGGEKPTLRHLEVGAQAKPGGMLLVVGEGKLSSHELRAPLVIGRDESCDVVIANASLSRRHAIVRPGPPVTVQDLGSTNGTRVGERAVRGGDEIALSAGGGFHIGPFSFFIVTPSPGTNPSSTGQDLLRVVDPTPAGVGSMIRDLAAGGTNVLILGETGAGKEVLAETIHGLSKRTGEFIRINCAALAEPLLESELFGHERGAFTGATAARAGLIEAAHGGTLFLDEIGELPAGIQAKLLRVLEQREVMRVGSTRPVRVDVRFIAATNRDLPAEVAAGRFRRDLYFRLDGVTLSIPPLRERVGQVGPLALHFLAEVGKRAGRPTLPLRAEVLAALEAYAWPGNVRELKAVIERAVLLARGASPGLRHLVFAPAAPDAPAPPTGGPPAGEPVLGDDERADRDRVLWALERCAGNQTRAAKLLDISRTTLVMKVRLYKIPRPRS
jgi:two-component system, NtrC family, response regulator AtoC